MKKAKEANKKSEPEQYLGAVFTLSKKESSAVNLVEKMRKLFGTIWKWVLRDDISVELTIKATKDVLDPKNINDKKTV